MSDKLVRLSQQEVAAMRSMLEIALKAGGRQVAEPFMILDRKLTTAPDAPPLELPNGVKPPVSDAIKPGPNRKERRATAAKST